MSSQIELIKENHLSIRGQLGQHLLIDPNIQKKIIDFLSPKPNEPILEIGPGLGALTLELLRRKAEVWAVEKDARFLEILKKECQAIIKDRLHLFHSDILTFDAETELPNVKQKKMRVVGNLPYYITAPILNYLFDRRDLFSEAVVMIQKEVAQRLLASPGTKDYGRLTLLARYMAKVELGFHVAPSCFTPQPEVASSVLRVSFYPKENRDPEIEEAWLFHLIQLAFSQRRKTFIHLMLKDDQICLTRSELEEEIKKIGYSVKVRGEELCLKDFMALSKTIKRGS